MLVGVVATRDDLRDCSVLEDGENSEAGISSQPAQQSGHCTACGIAQDCQYDSPLKADRPPGPEIPTILALFSHGLPYPMVNIFMVEPVLHYEQLL